MHLPLTTDVALEEAPSIPLGEPLLALRKKVVTKEAVIGVAGLGYVGLPLAMAYAKQGFRTLGIDLDAERIRRLKAGQSYIQDVDDGAVQQAVRAGQLIARDDYTSIGKAEVVFICVPTPVTPHKDPDTRYIEASTRSIAEHLRKGQLIVLKSTTFPNTTQELVQPILEEAASARGLELGRDYFLAFSPERVDPGNQKFTTEDTPVVVGGVRR